MSQHKPEQKQNQPPSPGPFGRRGPMMPSVEEKANDAKGTLRRLWTYFRHYNWALLAVVFFVIVSSGLDLMGPYLLSRAIDGYMLTGDIPGLLRISIIMLVVYVGASVALWLQAYIIIGISQRAVSDLRIDLFTKLQSMSLRYFDTHLHGDLMSRFTNDVDMISNVISDSIIQLISSALTIVGVAVMMFVLNVRLAIVSLVAIPLAIFVSQFIAKRTRRGFREQQEKMGNLNGMIEETITGQRVVKAYGREYKALEQFDVANRELQRSSTYVQIFAGVIGPLMNLVNNFSFAIVAGVGGWMAVMNMATVGTIAAFINYARQIARPLNQIAMLYSSIQSAIAGAERIFQVMDEDPEIVDDLQAVAMEQIQGDVHFSDVSFGYEVEKPVLKRVDMHVEPGQTVALVGPTGAGKTTIISLLTRFYDIDSGAITIDGNEIDKIKLDDLRRQLGIVLQDNFLFSTTVMENIRYGRLSASDAEVIQAAEWAHADQFILRLPKGYDTVLSERGSNLSQGQRQLLAIARAILADPSILILDEATSSVDTRTEVDIQRAMVRLMEGRTSFVIAHRLSTIRNADKILVINDGEVIEQGDHKSLMAQKGFYHNLLMQQYAGLN
ncbi:MAG: ABC transporter ATP-binding protein [Anaerolineales bacterium]|nr:ABC transporter ATP-binding protein [Anaerolineales bacterium]